MGCLRDSERILQQSLFRKGILLYELLLYSSRKEGDNGRGLCGSYYCRSN
jgi:hypothetical protein